MGRKKKKSANAFLTGVLLTSSVILASGLLMVNWALKSRVVPASARVRTDYTAENVIEATTEAPVEDEVEEKVMGEFVFPYKTENTKGYDIKSDYPPNNVLLMDAETGEVLAAKLNTVKMYPASLTKVMTLIIAVENIEDFNDTVEITKEMIDEAVSNDASTAGWFEGEKPTLDEVMYGIVLPSGADATIAAATYVAGSEKKFVKLMNEKAEAMGLKNTHFVNTSGLHDEDHYSTAEDMAAILSYAYNNERCRKYLSTQTYTLKAAEPRDYDIELTATLFKRMYGDEMPGVVIKGGKTGYTDEAMHCVMAFAEANDKTYIGVVCGSTSKWSSSADLLSLFSVYCVNGEPYDSTKNERAGT